MVQALRPGVGAVGARLLYPDQTLQHAGVLLGIGGVANHAHLGWPGEHPGYFSRAQLNQEMAAVTAACLVVRRDPTAWWAASMRPTSRWRSMMWISA